MQIKVQCRHCRKYLEPRADEYTSEMIFPAHNNPGGRDCLGSLTLAGISINNGMGE